MYLGEGLLEETQTIVTCELMIFELYMLMELSVLHIEALY